MIGLKELNFRSAKLRLENLELFRYHKSIKTEPETSAMINILNNRQTHKNMYSYYSRFGLIEYT